MTPDEEAEVERNRALARLVRPRIQKLARQGRAVDSAFKLTRNALYPDATPDQIAMMRAMFFAGAAELSAIQIYSIDDDDEPTEDDMVMFASLMDEIERHHGGMIQLAAVRHRITGSA